MKKLKSADYGRLYYLYGGVFYCFQIDFLYRIFNRNDYSYRW